MRAPYRIEAGDIVIRAYRPSDVPQVLEVTHQNVEHLAPTMPWVRTLPSDHDAMLDLLLSFRGKHDLAQDFTYGIFSCADGAYLGGTGLHPRVGPRAFEIGYWTAASHLRRGVASTACAALTRVGFELMNAIRIELHVEPSNRASLAIPERQGYLREGVRRKRLEFGANEFRDTVAFTMVHEDYPKSPAARLPFRAFDAMDRLIPLHRRRET